MSKRASEEMLEELHALQGQGLLEELKRCRESGEGVPPALFAQINKYLKDNGVDRPIQPGDPTELLSDEMPEFDDEGNVVKGAFGNV